MIHVFGGRPLRRAWIALALSALVAASALAEPVERWVRRNVESWLVRNHRPRTLVDADALAAEAGRLRAGGASPDELSKWLTRELGKADHAFAPAGAEHDEAARYALPFDPMIPRLLSQGANGAASHTGRQSESYDFVMPKGTPVRAAREGVVARVVDGFTEGGLEETYANEVLVLHADGTFAIYLHLSPGIPVKEGQRLARGELLGKSGHTGRSSAPHLHFAVARVDADGADRTTLPIRFGRPGTAGFVPKQGQFVGFPPKSNLELAVSVGGRETRPERPVVVRKGERMRIGVAARPAGRPPRVLDGHGRLQLVSMTPWNLTVSGRELTIEPMPGFVPELFPDQSGVAVLGVFFVNPAQREIGIGQVQFRIRDAAPAP